MVRASVEDAFNPWYPNRMAIHLPNPLPSSVDVSGLPPEAVRAVESLVAHLRATPQPTDEQFDRALQELASGPPVPTLPADWSRADLYDDHD
jgi:hypothetical protein